MIFGNLQRDTMWFQYELNCKNDLYIKRFVHQRATTAALKAALRSPNTGGQEPDHPTVQLLGPSHSTAHQNKPSFCIAAILSRASLSQFPLKNDHSSPSFHPVL